ncbi:MAG: phospho-N-acetylmuramoyl-pentapeptide-transferase [uncultured bacterium]|nr:MAG: phospho-N-acetylmuramoyl-pentapeptide-transferase [uncultured bacterium]
MANNVLSLALGLIIFSFLINSIFIVPFIDFLFKLKVTRQVEGKKDGKSLFDKLHDIKAGTPVGGGNYIIFMTTFLFLIIFPFAGKMGLFIQSAYNLRDEIWIIFITFIGFGLLGLIDDLIKTFGKGKTGDRPLGLVFGLSRSTKFIFQVILALIVSLIMYFNLGIHILHIPLVGITLNLGWLYIPFATFVIVAFSNAFNITDGLDGLASGLLLICLLAFGVIAAGNLDTPLSIFMAIWSGSLIAFLYFNVYPARIWLGDAGALSFGATLGLIGLLSGNVIALCVIGGIFIVEVLSSAIQIYGWRKLNRPILPLAPLHNTFMVKGWEEPKIVMRAWIIGIILAIFGLWLATI